MRLSSSHSHIICETLSSVFGNEAQVWLFGSRTDDTKRGGDIDLYIETPPQDNVFESKLRFKVSLLQQLGDQKIDILLHENGDIRTPMQQIAKESGVLL